MCVRVCLKFQDKSLIMKLKISWAANSLKTVIVSLQWTKRVPDLKLLKPISQKLVIIWKGDFSSKIWCIQITVDTVPIWVIKSRNYWHFLKSATFFNSKKRYLILNLSNSSSLILKPSLIRLSYPITPLKLLLSMTPVTSGLLNPKGFSWFSSFLTCKQHLTRLITLSSLKTYILFPGQHTHLVCLPPYWFFLFSLLYWFSVTSESYSASSAVIEPCLFLLTTLSWKSLSLIASNTVYILMTPKFRSPVEIFLLISRLHLDA